MELLLQVLVSMAVLFALARFGAIIVTKLGLPGLIGEIIVGIIVANIAGGAFLSDFLGIVIEDPTVGTESSEVYKVIYTLSELGVMFLLFTVGLETKVGDLLGSGKPAFLTALLGVILPFAAGAALILALGTYDFNNAMFLGAAMVATSVGITARIIKDMQLMDTKESRIIIAAAVIDDVLGMVVLAVVKGISSSAGGIDIVEVLMVVIKALVFVIGAILIAKYVVPKVYNYFDESKQKKINAGKVPYSFNKLIFAIIVCLSMAAIAEFIGLAAIIGAFLAGMMFANYAWEWELDHKVEAITTFLISFFFVNVGLQVRVDSLTDFNVISIALVVIALAVVTKYVGCGIGARLGDKTIDKQSFNIIGVGMMPRGEVGIIVASIGLSSGVLSVDLYAVVVLMSVMTTIIAPPILSSLFRKKYKEEYIIMPEDQI